MTLKEAELHSMAHIDKYQLFDPNELVTLNQSVAMAEELVCNHFKLSASQMAQLNYDIKTMADLQSQEIVEGHFAQIIRYGAAKCDSMLKTDVNDYYKICIQDHAIISAIKRSPDLVLYPFTLYIVCHELIHVVRFRRFLQHFSAPPAQRQAEEFRVHQWTRDILENEMIIGMDPVFKYYEKWQLSEGKDF